MKSKKLPPIVTLCVFALLSNVVIGQPHPVQLPKAAMNVGPYRSYGAIHAIVGNLAKRDREWRSNINSLPLHLTPSGFPACLAPGQTAFTWAVNNGGRFSAGRYRLRWSGTGNVMLDGNGVTEVQPGNWNRQRRYDVETNHGNFLRLTITETSSADPVRNIRLWLQPQGAEEPDLARQPGNSSWFRPGYVSDLTGFGVLRFMDWNETNNHENCSWQHRSTMQHAHWGARTLGIPYELQIALSNTVNADMWVTVPHAVDDEYVAELAELIHS